MPLSSRSSQPPLKADCCSRGGTNQSTPIWPVIKALPASAPCWGWDLHSHVHFAQGSILTPPIGGASGSLQGWRRETGLALSCLFPSASCGLPVSVNTIPAAILHRCRQCPTAAAAESSLQISQPSQNPFHTSLRPPPRRRHCQQLAGGRAALLRGLGPRQGPPSSEA